MEKLLLEKIKKQLKSEKAKIEKELEKIAKKNKNVKGDYQAEYVDIGNKDEENAQEFTLYENRLSLERGLEDILNSTVRALQKIEQGSYGVCDECGKQIPEARLRAYPSATLCLVCKNKERK